MVGLTTTLVALVFSLFPPEGTNPVWFLAKVIGGCAVLALLGWILYAGGGKGKAAA